MKAPIDPAFQVYARYAPIRDLRFYLAYAARHEAEYDTPTLTIVAEMASLAVELRTRLDGKKSTAPASTAAQKRIVWTLIDRFKASIAGWYGQAGAVRLEPLDVSDPLSTKYEEPRPDAAPAEEAAVVAA